MSSFSIARTTCALLAITGTVLAQNGAEDQRLLPNVIAADDLFGFEVDVSGDRMIVGAPLTDRVSLNDGAAYIYDRQPNGDWTFTAELLFTTPDQDDFFGYDVAIDGDRAAVSALLDDDINIDAGAVYIYENQGGGVWNEVAKITAADGMGNDQFGRSVALDGDRIAIGAWGVNGARGAVYVFDLVAGTWTQNTKLIPIGVGPGDQVGIAVDLDGDRVIGGSNLDDHSATADAGSAYIWEYNPVQMSWRERAKLIANPPGQNDNFGISVAIDGDRAIVGNPGQDSGGFVQNGSVHVFERTVTATWPQVDEFSAANNATSNQFGYGVALEGDRMLVGGNAANALRGAAYYLERQSGGTWLEIVEFEASDAIDGDFLGETIAMSGDNLVATAYGKDFGGTPGVGQVYTYTVGTLFHGPSEISLAPGGGHDLLVRAGPSFAGQVFLVLGSGSGTSPGLPDPQTGIIVPLNFDAYLQSVATASATYLFFPWFGFLDGNGSANSVFGLPPGSNPAFAGIELDHAVILIDLFGSGVLSLATNPVHVTLVP
jgi:hypothetical protein